MKILILTGDAKTLVYHRGALLEEMSRRGLEVVAGAAEDDGRARDFLESIGGRFVPLAVRRGSLNPLDDVRMFGAVVRWIREEDPDVFFAYAIKPVVYGTLAARLCGVMRSYVLIPGLGYAFTPDGTWKQRFVGMVSELLYRLALRHPCKVFLQNSDDEKLLRGRRILPARVPSHITLGSGVDLEKFAFREASVEMLSGGRAVRFVLVSRLLKKKGIREYVAVARAAALEKWDARFVLAGPGDDGPDGIPADEVRQWLEAGWIDYRGAVTDVGGLLSECDVFVLPTYYREGVPRSILEAMAVGLPVVTTRAVGSRETVRTSTPEARRLEGDAALQRGSNGILVEPGEPEVLKEALQSLVANRLEIAAMGEAGRRLAEQLFDVERVNEAMLREMAIPRMGMGRIEEAA